jgi:hypothetical protein
VTEGAERVLAVGGVAFAAVLLASGVIDDDRTDAYLLGLASFFLVGFLGALRAELRSAEGETSPFSATAVIGGSAAAAGYALLAAAYAAGGNVDPAPIAFAVCFPQAALLGAAGTAMARTGAVSGMLGFAGQALVPIQLASALILLSSTDHWALTVALGPFAAWVAVTAVLLLRPKAPASPATNGHRPRP